MTGVRADAAAAARDAVPFLTITAVWLVVMLVLYGVFLATKPNIDYPAWVHATVVLPALIGYLGHTLHQALTATR